MKFDRFALGKILVTPTVRVTDYKTGEVTVTPPTPGSIEAYIELENFTGTLTFGMNVTKHCGDGSKKVISAPVPMESDKKNEDDDVAISQQPKNTPCGEEDETNDESGYYGTDEDSAEDEYSLSDSFREMYFESRMESMM